MSAINQLEKVERDSHNNEHHPNDSHIDDSCNPLQRTLSIDLIQIAAAAAEEAIKKVLAPPSSKVANCVLDVDSSDSSHTDNGLSDIQNPITQPSQSDIPAHRPTRKVSECEPDDSACVNYTAIPNSKETISTSSDNNIGDIENHALMNMTNSFSRDKWLYKQIYNLMTENAEIWRVLSHGNVNMTGEEGNTERKNSVMFSQAYARVEISSTSESSLVQIVPTPVHFRMCCLDRDVPEQFRGLVFAQERTEEEFISRYGISASIYNNAVRGSDNSSRPSLIHDFALHLTKINDSLVKARDHYVEAEQWNEFVGKAVIKWVRKFPKPSMSSNFFIRRNIGVDDVIALLQILSPRKPAVVEDAVSYQRVA